MNIIEELWYGNISPCERDFKKGSKYSELRLRQNRKKKPSSALTAEIKALRNTNRRSMVNPIHSRMTR